MLSTMRLAYVFGFSPDEPAGRFGRARQGSFEGLTDMNRFSWASAARFRRLGGGASVTVADAMTTIHGTHERKRDIRREGRRHRPARPAQGKSAGSGEGREGLKDIADLTVIVEQAEACASWIIGHGSPAWPPMLWSVRPRLSSADQMRTELPASPQTFGNVATVLGGPISCNGRRPGWVFQGGGIPFVLRKGGGPLLRDRWRNQYHAIFGRIKACAIVHPSTVATVLVALGARLGAQGCRRCDPDILLEDFFVSPDHDLQRENDLKPA